jgi:hypothetical protein
MNREQIMKIESGVWIDHRQAIIVILGNEKPEIRHVIAQTEKHLSNPETLGPRDDTITHQRDVRDRKYDQELLLYYDSVIANFPTIGQVLIMGPGEAKIELQNRVNYRGHGNRIAEVATADNLTEPQLVAYLRHYYEGSRAGEK